MVDFKEIISYSPTWALILVIVLFGILGFGTGRYESLPDLVDDLFPGIFTGLAVWGMSIAHFNRTKREYESKLVD